MASQVVLWMSLRYLSAWQGSLISPNMFFIPLVTQVHDKAKRSIRKLAVARFQV